MGMPPTGKTVIVNGLELFRLHDGKIVEFWRKDDDVSLLIQLGMLPAPQPASCPMPMEQVHFLRSSP